MKCILIATALIACFLYANAHTIPYPGKLLNPEELTCNTTVKLKFQVLDLSNNFVTYDNLIEQMTRKMHVVIISKNWEVFWHFHPEDFGNMTQMSADRAYYVEVNFPYSGDYLFTADFVYANDGYPIGVSASFAFTVNGSSPQPNRKQIYQYPMQTSMKVKGLPLQPEDTYQNAVYLDQQFVSGSQPGYPVSIDIMDYTMMANMSMKRMQMDIPIYRCFILRVNVGDNNGPQTDQLIPFLGANLHISAVHESFTEIVHLHGMEPKMMNVSQMGIMCDDHRLTMPAPSSHFGPTLEAAYVPEIPGRWIMIMQMKYNSGANGQMLVAAFDFTVSFPGGMSTTGMDMNHMNMSSTGMMMDHSLASNYTAAIWLVLVAVLAVLGM